MDIDSRTDSEKITLSFYGGIFGAILPFIVFVMGVIAVALSGAPDERGFWPILVLALGLSLLLARDKSAFSKVVIRNMSQEIVMIMIMAWILASTIGVLMTITGFVEALTWVAAQLHLGSTGYVLSTFIICCIVSLSTGSSFATILICSPLLYPAGGLLGAPLPVLAGAILGGATFGDFIAPISDTTIASALSQNAQIGPTVKSRFKYVVPAFVLALVAYYLSAMVMSDGSAIRDVSIEGDPRGLPMLLVPVFIIVLFLKGKHLVHGLMMGLLAGIVLGLVLGLLPMSELFALDIENFTVRSFIIRGIDRAIGISIFTILLMGLVGTLISAGIVDRLVAFAEKHTHTARQAEGWIAGVMTAAVMLITHSVVAILTIADFSRRTGERTGVSPVRRANILSLAGCVFPFLLPYFIPVILMANMTSSGEEFGIGTVSPLETGMYNFIAWALFVVFGFVVFAGYGRTRDNAIEPNSEE